MSQSAASTAPLVRRFSRNTTGRDLVVGDVHGCFSKLHADCPRPTWAEFRASLEAGGLEAEHVAVLARWSRERISVGDRIGVPDVRAVVVGHTPVERPVALGNVLHIDTGAWLQGGLSPRAFTILDAATLRPAVPDVS